MRRWFVFFSVILILLPAGLRADVLPRRASLGVALLAVNDSLAALHGLEDGKGVLVSRVVEHSSAEDLGIREGDIILQFNDEEVVNVSRLVVRVSSQQEGDEARVRISRNGQIIWLEGILKGAEKEQSEVAEVIYDAVPFEDGYVRTIIHRPKGEGRHPAFFFIQGYGCNSLDNMPAGFTYENLLSQMSEKGYVVIKTEKPGVGDSRSSRSCSEIDLFEETAVFTASYNALKKYDFIDLENVFVFGYSMGGVQAPLMETDFDPRGIMVFGTAVRPWFMYFIEQVQTQRLINGQDYILNEANHELAIRFFYRFMIEKESPDELWEDAEMRNFLTSYWNYSGNGLLGGRHYTYWQQLQDMRLFEAWSKTPAFVLSLWGEGDMVAFNPYEHELIADVVNYYNPGKARFVKVPYTDHGLHFVRDQQHSGEIWGDWEYRQENYNQLTAQIIHKWMQEVMLE